MASSKVCSKCKIEKELIEFYKDKTMKSGYKSECKSCHKKWRDNNRDRTNARERNRRQIDPQFRIKGKMYARLKNIINRGDIVPRTEELLGCAVTFFLDWIEFQFVGKMGWDNHGKIWSFDHLAPLNSFDLTNEEQLKQAMHYTNIRPCLIKENILKGNKIIPHLLVCRDIVLKRFLNKNSI